MEKPTDKEITESMANVIKILSESKKDLEKIDGMKDLDEMIDQKISTMKYWIEINKNKEIIEDLTGASNIKRQVLGKTSKIEAFSVNAFIVVISPVEKNDPEYRDFLGFKIGDTCDGREIYVSFD